MAKQENQITKSNNEIEIFSDNKPPDIEKKKKIDPNNTRILDKVIYFIFSFISFKKMELELSNGNPKLLRKK